MTSLFAAVYGPSSANQTVLNRLMGLSVWFVTWGDTNRIATHFDVLTSKSIVNAMLRLRLIEPMCLKINNIVEPVIGKSWHAEFSAIDEALDNYSRMKDDPNQSLSPNEGWTSKTREPHLGDARRDDLFS